MERFEPNLIVDYQMLASFGQTGEAGRRTAPSPGLDLDEQDAQSRKRILIIDDDPDIIALLKVTLRKAGFDVAGAHGGASAVEKAAEFQPDLFLLDLMMPDVDGWETLKRLRQLTDAPVVIISAKGQKQDVISGLDQGADDYMPKPFYPPEVVSRVNAVLRRSGASSPITTRVFPEIKLAVDHDTHEVVIEGTVLALSPKEFAVLELLATAAPKPVSYETLAESVWGSDSPGVRNRTKWVIHRLRAKLDGERTESLIINRVGFGYQLNTASQGS